MQTEEREEEEEKEGRQGVSQVHHLFITASLATQHPRWRGVTRCYIKSAASFQTCGTEWVGGWTERAKHSALTHQCESVSAHFQLRCCCKEAVAHPSAPGGTGLSLRSSGGSSSSDEPALDDSSSLSARQYVRGLGLSHTHTQINTPSLLQSLMTLHRTI